jgi:hypothetical protein
MSHPYKSLPKTAFWRNTVIPKSLEGIYTKKYNILPQDRIATAGSCFAQEISRGLRRTGYVVYDAEPPPEGLSTAAKERFQYSVYSARYGNIYTSANLLQLIKEALGLIDLSEYAVWELPNGRFVDAFRPTVEPDGLDSRDEVLAHRAHHLGALRRMFQEMSVFVFTLGLTEVWRERSVDFYYAMCPGVSGGTFDSDRHEFRNLSFNEISNDLREAIQLLRSINPGLRFLFTVSPVPLIATASQQHVLTATTFSKSILRAVAGTLYQEYDFVDYFPSYEIAISPWIQDNNWQDDQRSVTRPLVDRILSVFFSQHPPVTATTPSQQAHQPEDYTPAHCDELLLDQFSNQ